MDRRTPPSLWTKLKPLVKENRATPTSGEAALWKALRAHGLEGYKFRRQHAIGRFIVDFYCSKARLVIEVDGPIHERTQREDRERQDFLQGLDLRVLRFTNGRVLGEIDEVLAEIEEALRTSPPAAATPSPPCGEGD